VNNGKDSADASMAEYAGIPAGDIPLTTGNTTSVGPLWLGKLQKKTIVQEIRTIASAKELSTKNMLWKLLFLLEEEADAPPFFYTTNDLSSLLKRSPPPMEHIFEHLRTKGFIVTRTHCTPTGFKTNAPLDVITEVFK
jgi:tRNA (guanine26-N2/guanine27-N2)-dimethyltransferase